MIGQHSLCTGTGLYTMGSWSEAGSMQRTTSGAPAALETSSALPELERELRGIMCCRDEKAINRFFSECWQCARLDCNVVMSSLYALAVKSTFPLLEVGNGALQSPLCHIGVIMGLQL